MPSYKDAVEAKCRECIFDPDSSGTWREQVRDCTSPACPLYALRPQPIRVVRDASKRPNMDPCQPFYELGHDPGRGNEPLRH